MKCRVTSSTSHEVLISKEISYKSYKEICRGEPKKVNLGYWGDILERGVFFFKIENNSLLNIPRDHLVSTTSAESDTYPLIHGTLSRIPYDWEVLTKFFSIHNIEPNWLYCNYRFGHYDEELGGWTGCVGKV